MLVIELDCHLTCLQGYKQRISQDLDAWMRRGVEGRSCSLDEENSTWILFTQHTHPPSGGCALDHPTHSGGEMKKIGKCRGKMRTKSDLWSWLVSISRNKFAKKKIELKVGQSTLWGTLAMRELPKCQKWRKIREMEVICIHWMRVEKIPHHTTFLLVFPSELLTPENVRRDKN